MLAADPVHPFVALLHAVLWLQRPIALMVPLILDQLGCSSCEVVAHAWPSPSTHGAATVPNDPVCNASPPQVGLCAAFTAAALGAEPPADACGAAGDVGWQVRVAGGVQLCIDVWCSCCQSRPACTENISMSRGYSNSMGNYCANGQTPPLLDLSSLLPSCIQEEPGACSLH